MNQTISDKRLYEFFSENNLNGSVHHYTAAGRQLRYISMGEDHLPGLFFIHGSPANVIMYEEYYKDPLLRKTFKMYAVDRPGYGGSGYGQPEPSIEKQAEMIRPVIEQVKRPVIIVAASYGSSIACRLLMDHPDIADAALMDSPAMAPGQEKQFRITPVIEHSFVRNILLGHHRSANTEKFHHHRELEKMLPHWHKIKVPIKYLQGKHDNMVYTTNADFARRHLTNVPYLQFRFFENRQHLTIMKETEAVRNEILELYAYITNTSVQDVLQEFTGQQIN